MANIFQRAVNYFSKQQLAQAIYGFGGGWTAWDANKVTILYKGYGQNPDVFAAVNGASRKSMAVPYEIKKIKDKRSFQKLHSLEMSTKGNYTPKQYITKALLESHAYEDESLPFPMDRPNALQTWDEIISLYKTYIDVVGDFYLYKLAPQDGMNKGVPKQVFALPADKMNIVLKTDIDLLSGENPIDHYLLLDGAGYIQFQPEEIIHIKTPNPFFDITGKHLYGLSRLQAALRNIQSSNLAIDNNNKTMANSGVFGFIHGKTGATPLTSDQAHGLKERLLQMDADPSRLANIAGASGEIAFTRISLTTEELRPFEYLAFDRNVICNVLNYPYVLLDAEKSGGLGSSDRTIEAKKSLLIDNVLPDLNMFARALEKEFLPLFRGYENTCMDFDISEMPEMQQDMVALTSWLERAPITPNEFRQALKYLPLKLDGMDTVYVPMNKVPIDQENVSTEDFNNAFDVTNGK